MLLTLNTIILLLFLCIHSYSTLNTYGRCHIRKSFQILAGIIITKLAYETCKSPSPMPRDSDSVIWALKSACNDPETDETRPHPGALSGLHIYVLWPVPHAANAWSRSMCINICWMMDFGISRALSSILKLWASNFLFSKNWKTSVYTRF